LELPLPIPFALANHDPTVGLLLSLFLLGNALAL
jgi:hypothetical protein